MKLLALALLSSFLSTVTWAQTHDTRLMTTGEYKDFLDRVEGDLPKLEAALKSIDPAKANVSYAAGKQIERWRDLGLKEATWARQSMTKERTKHTVSGELALHGFLEGVFNAMDSIVATEIAAGATLSDLEKYAPEISTLVIRVANDVTARVQLLERATCP